MKENETNNTTNTHAWIKSITLTTLGWELALPIFGGVIIGHLLDNYFFTGFRYTLILLFFGLFLGYYNLYRVIELDLLRTKAAKLRKNKRESQP